MNNFPFFSVQFFYIFNKIAYICKIFLWKPFKALRYFDQIFNEVSFKIDPLHGY